ncbi:ferritin-like domain-containing protein [Fulvivirgaceae bacterium BMA10]|uniref:Ferritin-like domain-containing protein n=1 Tax=Splendidivirga corallicola TaxID=3051826 RepID=A0ABT8KK65_9BACT|nr:ferritin-like domain-containing protein [Fulvivirgaceae bacterium BMA10]
MNFEYWFYYFQQNQNHFAHIDFDVEPSLTNHEKCLVTSSIQQFQKGENSEGKHLYNYAKAYGDHFYLQAIKLFIKEEQDHAKVLGKWMHLEGIPKIKGHWVDGAFRKIRNLFGLELSITVLVTAEIIAAVYYKALKLATGSSLLKSLCDQILIDEDKHLEFQAHTMAILNREQNYASIFTKRLLHKMFMAATIMLVWFYHGSILKAGGYNFLKYWKDVFQVFNTVDTLIWNKLKKSMEKATHKAAA